MGKTRISAVRISRREILHLEKEKVGNTLSCHWSIAHTVLRKYWGFLALVVKPAPPADKVLPPVLGLGGSPSTALLTSEGLGVDASQEDSLL